MHPLFYKIDIKNSSPDTICSEVEKLGLQIKKLGHLAIVKYPKELKQSRDDFIRCSRGLIIDLENKQIANYSLDGALGLDEFFDRVDISDIVVEKMLDGTLCNLYYHNNKWCVSTKFSIDASISKFRNNKSFRQLLDDVVDIDKLPLDPKFSYSLLLQHTSNRIVTPIDTNRVFFLESTNNVTGEKVFTDIGLPTVPIVSLFGQSQIAGLELDTIEKLVDYSKNLEWKEPGLMLFSKDRKYRCSLYSSNYSKIKELLNNEFNIKFLFTRLLLNKQYLKVGEILTFYPEYRPLFLEVEDAINSLCSKTFEYYFRSKIARETEFVEIPREYRKILVDCHKRYKEEMTNGNSSFKINISIVREELSKYDTALSYSMIFPKTTNKN